MNTARAWQGDTSGSIAEAGQPDCTVEASTLTWGFKESFRSYISGTIAGGEWTVADGASYETPSFGWTDGVGSYDAATGEGVLAFAGSIEFTGHGGVLDTTVANPVIEFVDGDSAVLLLDVSGTTQQGASVSETGVEFADIDLSGANLEWDGGVLTVTDAAAVLTTPGAEAFGTYPAGEELDPVSFTLAVDETCAAAAPDVIDPDGAAAGADLGWLLWLAAVVVIVVGAVAAIVIRVRSRRV